MIEVASLGYGVIFKKAFSRPNISYRFPIGFVLFKRQKPPCSSYPRKRV